MTLVILVDRLVFGIILTMYFSHRIERTIIGLSIVIENNILHYLFYFCLFVLFIYAVVWSP